MSLGKKHGLETRRVAAVIAEVSAAVADWRTQAIKAGVSKDSVKMVRDAHARVMADFRSV